MKKEIKDKIINYIVKCGGMLGVLHSRESLFKELKEKYNISNDYDKELKEIINKYLLYCYFD